MSDRTRQNAHAAIARRSWRRYGRPDDAGASLVEFAIILPVFVLMLFGMIQFGLGFAGWDELRNAVQTGARLAANDDVNPSDPNCGRTNPTQQMQLMVCENLAPNWATSGHETCCSRYSGTNPFGHLQLVAHILQQLLVARRILHT